LSVHPSAFKEHHNVRNIVIMRAR